jgi:hypothetical protein
MHDPVCNCCEDGAGDFDSDPRLIEIMENSDWHETLYECMQCGELYGYDGWSRLPAPRLTEAEAATKYPALFRLPPTADDDLTSHPWSQPSEPAPAHPPAEPPTNVTVAVDLLGAVVPRPDTNLTWLQALHAVKDSPGVPGAIDALHDLATTHRVILLTHAADSKEFVLRKWLENHHILERIGLTSDDVHFIRRADRLPAETANLDVTYLVDDRNELSRLARTGIRIHRLADDLVGTKRSAATIEVASIRDIATAINTDLEQTNDPDPHET